jgi:transposase
MEKKTLQAYISKGMSMRKIATAESVSYPTIRHWIKKHGLQTKTKLYNEKGDHKCNCGEHDPDAFYGNKKQICGKCQNKYNTEKARQTKRFIVNHLGGKCAHCGYDKCLAALDVHHTDPKIKDPQFKTAKYWNRERLIKELKSCILLCRNCHAEEHYKD